MNCDHTLGSKAAATKVYGFILAWTPGFGNAPFVRGKATKQVEFVQLHLRVLTVHRRPPTPVVYVACGVVHAFRDLQVCSEAPLSVISVQDRDDCFDDLFGSNSDQASMQVRERWP